MASGESFDQMLARVQAKRAAGPVGTKPPAPTRNIVWTAGKNEGKPAPTRTLKAKSFAPVRSLGGKR